MVVTTTLKYIQVGNIYFHFKRTNKNDDYFMGDDCIKIEQNEDKAIAFLKMERKRN